MDNRFKFYLSLSFLYALLIFYPSSMSSLGDPRAVLDIISIGNIRDYIHYVEHSDFRFLLYPLYIFANYPDKIAHMVLYAVFGFLLYLTLKNSSNIALRNYAFIFAIIIGTAYGVSDEFHQSFVPGRTASISDLLADSIGVTIAQALVFIKERL